MTANAGNYLMISSIFVFLIGYIIRQVQDDDDLFKSIKFNVNEFVGKGYVVDKFNIKCRYLKADERIDNKAKKIHKQILFLNIFYIITNKTINIQLTINNILTEKILKGVPT
jgi:hypothetical protein